MMINASVSLKAIRSNIKKLSRNLLPDVKICAVLKANAYHLGDLQIAQAVLPYVDWFAVANLKEAVRLRLNNIAKSILLFGVCEDFEQAIQHNITISINHLREMKALARVMNGKKRCKVHIKVNTGMNRYGITNIWQLKSILSIAKTAPGIQVDGLYTHLSHESENLSEIDKQLKKFNPFKAVIRSHYPKAIIHAAASGSAEYLPAQFDMVRVGKLLYGGIRGYKTAIMVTSSITAVQQLNTGVKIGYRGTETAKHPMVCGVVPCGYADLAHFNYSGKLHVLIDKKPCKILGRVCMDTFMVDVTNIQNPIGKKVTIISNQKGQTLMDISEISSTIVCVLLCNLNFDRSEIVYSK